MYPGRVVCCTLVSHVEYAPRALLRLEKDKADRLTDKWTPDHEITLIARHGQCNNCTCNIFRVPTVLVIKISRTFPGLSRTPEAFYRTLSYASDV